MEPRVGISAKDGHAAPAFQAWRQPSGEDGDGRAGRGAVEQGRVISAFALFFRVSAPFLPRGLYQRRGMFPSDKGSDVQAVYQGIWYDEENAYLVGSRMSMKRGETRAHLIRRYDVHLGADRFDIRPLLAAASVQFVRHNQYTVYPYPFHLIDLYVENVLRYAQSSSGGSLHEGHEGHEGA